MKNLPLVSEHENVALDDGEQLILCPVCRNENTHFEYTPVINRPENYLSGHRGGGYAIPMRCENDHYWNLIISHHKGYSYVTTDNHETQKI